MGKPSDIVVASAGFRELSAHFYVYLQQLGYSARYNRSKVLMLHEFLHWLECRGIANISAVSAADLHRYYGYLCERPGKKDGGILSPSTVHRHLLVVRDLFILLHQEGRLGSHPFGGLSFTRPPGERPARTILTPGEIRQLYKASVTAQERAILSLAYGCGLRAGELEKCNVEDIKLSEKLLVVPEGKGNKRRVIPLSGGVVRDLSAYYYRERPLLAAGRDHRPSEQAFILHSRGGRMHDDTYNKYLKRIIARTGSAVIREKGITIHSLRHSIATHLLAEGVSVEQVRMFLGHASLETTQLYTHISQGQLSRLIE